MTDEEAIAALKALGGDEEANHAEADGIVLRVLREHGLGDIADEWEAASERVGFWYA